MSDYHDPDDYYGANEFVPDGQIGGLFALPPKTNKAARFWIIILIIALSCSVLCAGWVEVYGRV